MSKIIKSRFVVNGDKNVLSFNRPMANKLTKETSEELYQETKAMLEEMVAQAQARADNIMLMAKENAQKLMEQAEQESQAIKDSAFQEGYAEGLRTGLENGENQVKPLYPQVLSLIEEIAGQKDSLIKEQEKNLIELTLAITEKLLGTIIEAKPEIICHIVKNSLELVRETERITVKVNPIHIPYLSGCPELIKDVNKEKLQIVEDSAIRPGDCQIATENGFLDLMIDEQLAVLKEALLEVVEHA